MPAERLSFVVPSKDLPGAASFWSSLLGVDATFVDGDRWAQFDLGGGRLSLAGTDRAADGPAAMVKVADLDEACERIKAAGYQVSAVTEGAHERRAVVDGPDGWPVVLYSPPKAQGS